MNSRMSKYSIKLTFMIVFAAVVYAQRDGCDPFCSCESETVLCSDLSRFPRFLTTGWIVRIYIVGGRLTTLPTLSDSEFVRLTELILRNCPNLRCGEIFAFIQRHPRILVRYDNKCNFTTDIIKTHTMNKEAIEITTTTPLQAKLTSVNVIVTVCVGVVVSISVAIILGCIYFKRKNDYRVSVPMLELDDISIDTTTTLM